MNERHELGKPAVADEISEKQSADDDAVECHAERNYQAGGECERRRHDRPKVVARRQFPRKPDRAGDRAGHNQARAKEKTHDWTETGTKVIKGGRRVRTTAK